MCIMSTNLTIYLFTHSWFMYEFCGRIILFLPNCLSCRTWKCAKIFIWNAVLFLLTPCTVWLKCKVSVTDLWETVINCMHVYVKIVLKKEHRSSWKTFNLKWLGWYVNFNSSFKQSGDLTECGGLRIIVLHCLCYEIMCSYRHLTLQKTVS